MLKEKEKRPNNKRDEGKTFNIGEREDAIWTERRAKIIIWYTTRNGIKLHFEFRLDC